MVKIIIESGFSFTFHAISLIASLRRRLSASLFSSINVRKKCAHSSYLLLANVNPKPVSVFLISFFITSLIPEFAKCFQWYLKVYLSIRIPET